MSDSKTEQRLLGSFDSTQWAGPSSGSAGCLFFVTGFLVFLACLILMIFIPLLRNPLAYISVCTTVAAFLEVRAKNESSKQEQAFLPGFLGRINEGILQLTGNANDELSADQLRTLITSGKKLPLLVNGVPGVELRVVRDRPTAPKNASAAKGAAVITTTRVLVEVAAPDYGVTSFDRLLAAELSPSV